MVLRFIPSIVICTVVMVIGACAVPAPIKPILPPVTPISQCKDVFPDTYTRPVPTGKPIFLLPSIPSHNAPSIMWLDRSCNYWYVGPYDPGYPPFFCYYRPDLGDRYYATVSQAMFVGVPPQACPA